MKLFLVTHFQSNSTAHVHTTYVAAESMEVVARIYDCEKIELVHRTVMVLNTPQDSSIGDTQN